MNSNKKNNIVVGLFVTLALFVLLFGIYFLEETSPGQKSDVYKVRFDQVSTLQDGDPVKVNGVKAGKVQGVELRGRRVLVTLKLNRGVRLPKDSRVRIQNIGLMGERQVGIMLGESEGYFAPGEEMEGELDAGIAEAMGTAGEVFKEAETLVHNLRAVIDSTVGKPEFASSFNQAVRQTADLTRKLNRFLDDIDPKVKQSLNNLEAAGSQVRILVRDQDAPVREMVRNGREVSSQLKDVVKKADQTADEVNKLLAKLNSDQSSLGAMLNDTAFYGELRSTLNSADSLFRQIKKKGLDVNLDLF
jgi:phospholipid/cholesterol/gamma-HCH transport system substrate-binding protein